MRNTELTRCRCRYFTRLFVPEFTRLSVVAQPPTLRGRINKEGAIRPDICVLVDPEGQNTTLFQLVEMGDAREAARLAGEHDLPVVTVDVALPSTEPLEPTTARAPGARKARRVEH